MPISKVVFGSTSLIDLTSDTVTAAKIESGTTAHDKSGNHITGTMVVQTCYVGSGAPASSLGSNGDIYIDLG